MATRPTPAGPTAAKPASDTPSAEKLPAEKLAAEKPAVAKAAQPAAIAAKPANGKPAVKPAAGAPAPRAAAAGAPRAAAGAAVLAGLPDDLPDEVEELVRPRTLVERVQDFLRDAPSWLASSVVHVVLVIILALITLSEPAEKEHDLVATATDPTEQVEELEEQQIEDLDIEQEITETDAFQPVASTSVADQVTETASALDDAAAAPVQVELSDVGFEKAPQTDIMSEVGSFSGRGLEGRGEQARAALVRERGGTAESEAAVARALKWLAEHQLPNGSWSFNHTAGLCQGRCPNPGRLDKSNMAATGMALLPFLGAGNTHRKGKYAKNVHAGLYYLVNNMKVGPNGGAMNFDGGRMYGHGICSIALCEAYGMTQDKALFAPAQAALNFIAYAQDPVGGGWRYEPRTPGDTSVVGWQLMALKSGHMSYLNVNPNVIRGADNFLNTVQTDSGAAYGYAGPGGGQATTAIGLLCRMYLGWKHDHPALERGVQKILAWGPSPGNMYYNYYATNVLAQYEGEPWKQWNPKMRDFLVEKQSKAGHTEGSWYLDHGDHGAHSGGRLYVTCMATMILEVYYRHMPIYRKQATDDDFPD